MKVSINSEIGELEGVILHTPGVEIENMTYQTRTIVNIIHLITI